MRSAVLVLAVASLLGCRGNKSKLDDTRAGSVDVLWDLAPDGTDFAIVASPRAVDLSFRGLAAARELTSKPDFGLVKPQLDAIAEAMFGGDTATPADAGFSAEKSFAVFRSSDGLIAVMPVGDRDKFVMSKGGTRGTAAAGSGAPGALPSDDTIEGNTCRQRGAHYICVSAPAMFDRIGKGSLRGKIASVVSGPAAAGTATFASAPRGDVELYLAALPLFDTSVGELAITVQLEPGQVALHGRWAGTPSGPFAQLAGLAAPAPDTNGASGFVALNIGPLLHDAPPLPIAGGVTFQQLAQSLAGPLTAIIPAGSVDIQMFAPLADPKPAQTIIDNCQDVGMFFELAKTQTPGACRLVLQGTNELELDTWVEASTLRLGARKGPRPPGKRGAITAAGRGVAKGTWSAAFWCRGTMHNLSGITPSDTKAPPEVALSIHAMALVNELGAGVRVDQNGLRFRAFARTVWTNPPALVDRIVSIAGNDIVTGKASEATAAIAADSAGSPFAADFDAGQGGLMIPAAMIGLASAFAIPAFMRMVGADREDGSGLDDPMNQADLVSLLLRAYVEEAYPKWRADHPKKKCPASIDDLAKYFGEDPGLPVTTDPWGHALVMTCDDKGFAISSVGPDGKPGTADDVRP
jgi:hypothetical protein